METLPDERLERLLLQRRWLQRVALDLVREPSLAEDAVQEAWLAALERPPQGPEGPWLAAVVRRAALYLSRSEGRRREREERAARPEAVRSPEELHEQIEIEERLARELRALAEPYRTTLLRRYVEGLSAAEIARVEGVPEGTVRWRTKRGLEELRRRLAPALGEREALALALGPLLRAAPAGAVAGGAWIGGLLMGWKGWVAAAVVVGLGLAAWRGSVERVGPTRALERGDEPARVALEAAAPEAPHASDVPADGEQREPIAVAAATPAPRVRVVDARGRALAGLAVQWRAAWEEVAEEARLDAEGGLDWPAGRTGPVELAVERERCFPHLAALDLRPGEQELGLPDGLELSGAILVDGTVPSRPLRLELFPQRGAGAWRDTPPASLFERDRVRVTTDERGGFVFLGLEPRDYELVVPRGHALAGGLELADPDFPLTLRIRPTTGQVFELERFPGVHGRVLLADGTPVQAELSAHVTWNGHDGMSIGAATDETGAFEMYFARAWRTLDVEGHARGAGARGEFHFESAVIDDGDLGELVLERGSSLALRVLDEAGAPIEGAVTTAGDRRTGADGRLELTCVTAPFDVAAYGYLARTVQPVAGEAEVRLARGPGLELVVLDSGGQPVPEAPLRVEASHALLDGPDGRIEAGVWRSDPARVGRFRVAGNRKEGGIYAEFVCDDEGRWRAGGVLPGVSFRLKVGLRDLPAFHEEVVPALGPTELRRVEVRLPFVRATLHGRVIDAEGRGVPGVRCTVPEARFHGHREELYCTSDRRGWFECFLLLPPELPGPIPVRLQVLGFRERALEWDPAEPGPLEVRLDAGRRVLVTVVDSSGATIPGGQVLRRPLGAPSWAGATRLRPGVFEANGLEEGLYEFKLDLAGREYTRTHSTADDELRFAVERPARVRVRWSIETVEPHLRWLQVRLAPRDEGGLPYRLDDDGYGYSRTDALAGSAEFRAVAPGAYDAVLELQEDDEPIVLGRRSIEVVEGQKLEVEIRARR